MDAGLKDSREVFKIIQYVGTEIHKKRNGYDRL